MFLLKESIWDSDLHLGEPESEIKNKVKELRSLFTSDGILNKNSYLIKAESYTKVFIEFFHLDKCDYEKQISSGNEYYASQGIPQKMILLEMVN